MKKTIKKVLNIFSTVLLLLCTALVVTVFALRLSGAKPKAFGYYIFNVASDSMTPMLEVGDVILVKECSPADVHKDDVITYHATSGEMAGNDITHKVIEEPVKDTGGTIRIKTKGTKEGAIVDPIITGDQVIGRFERKLVVLSFIYSIFRKWYGLLAFLLIILALIGKEMYNLMKLSNKVDKIEIQETNDK